MQNLDEAITRVRAGDTESFSLVIEAWHVPIRALISALVADPHDSEDLAQQTFVFAYEHLEDYRPGTNLGAWLKAIARNLVRDYHNRRGLRREGMEQYLRFEIARKTAGSISPEELDSRLAMLASCVEELPQDQRTLLRMAHDRFVTLDRMAARIGKPATALRKRISRLYELIRRCIQRRSGTLEATS